MRRRPGNPSHAHRAAAMPAVAALLALLVAGVPAPAQPASADEPTGLGDGAIPDKFRNAAVQQNLDAKLPLDLTFTDHHGEKVKLGKYFNNGKPVVMAMMYYKCPMLCGLVLNTMFDNLKEIAWTPGEQYEALVISFDHREDTRLARTNQQGYAANFGRPGAGKGFHFHTSDKANARRLADVLGFPYQYDEASGQYSHPSAVFVITPDGRISKYLTGLMYKPRTLRLAMVEASDGKVGSLADQVLLLCSHYDDSAGYVASAVKIMNLSAPVAGVMIVVTLVVVIRKARRARAAQWATAPATTGDAPGDDPRAGGAPAGQGPPNQTRG